MRRFEVNLRQNVLNGDYLKSFARHIHAQLVLSTPVDKGVARSNWFFSLNVPSRASNAELTDPEDSRRTLPQKVDERSTLFITNNLPYILRLEQGHSQQAPNGFVKRSIRNARTNFLAEVASANRR